MLCHDSSNFFSGKSPEPPEFAFYLFELNLKSMRWKRMPIVGSEVNFGFIQMHVFLRTGSEEMRMAILWKRYENGRNSINTACFHKRRRTKAHGWFLFWVYLAFFCEWSVNNIFQIIDRSSNSWALSNQSETSYCKEISAACKPLRIKQKWNKHYISNFQLSFKILCTLLYTKNMGNGNG